MKPHTLFPIFFTVVLLSHSVFAASYDNDTLNIFAKIAPRLVLMSSQKQKIEQSDNSKLSLCIVYDIADQGSANSLMDKIEQNYPKGIANHSIEITSTLYDNLTECKKSLMVILFDTDNTNIDKSVDYSIKNEKLSMSYNPNFLENGVGISMFIGRKVSPYINMDTLNRSNIKINNVLLRVSKIYSQQK